MQYIHNTTSITFEVVSQIGDKVILKAVAIGTSSLMKVGEPYKCSSRDLDIAFTIKKQSLCKRLFGL